MALRIRLRQGEQIFDTTDDIAERARSAVPRCGPSARSRLQRVSDNDAEFVSPQDMLAELREDNKDLTQRMREVHDLCDEHGDVATASLLENWIDEVEKRTWFLFEASRDRWAEPAAPVDSKLKCPGCKARHIRFDGAEGARSASPPPFRRRQVLRLRSRVRR